MVIANKSGGEKQNKFCTEQWIFALWLQMFFLKKLRKFVLIVWVWEKNAQKIERNQESWQTEKLRKKEKEKENTGTEVYMCAL